jgi:hypothetical protein
MPAAGLGDAGVFFSLARRDHFVTQIKNVDLSLKFPLFPVTGIDNPDNGIVLQDRCTRAAATA